MIENWLALAPLARLALSGYVAVMLLLAVCGLHRYSLILRARRAGGEREPPPAPSRLPVVTVQLPLYNEAHVAARLIRAAAELDWPRERLEIQVLDDSDDDTVELVRATVRRVREGGVDIHHLRRAERSGFKAGALARGLAR